MLCGTVLQESNANLPEIRQEGKHSDRQSLSRPLANEARPFLTEA